jgi:spore germination protein GerM
MSRRVKIITLIVLGTALAAFFYLRVLAKRIFVENPISGEQEAHTRLSQAALQSEAGPQQTVVLYFPVYDQNVLHAESRQLSWANQDNDRIRQVLLALIEGPRQGHGRALPAGTTIRAVFVAADGTALVDFDTDVVAGFDAGIESETLAVYAVVNSITANLNAVKRVKILIEGKETETLDGHLDLTGYFVPDPSRIATGL